MLTVSQHERLMQNGQKAKTVKVERVKSIHFVRFIQSFTIFYQYFVLSRLALIFQKKINAFRSIFNKTLIFH